MTSGKAPVVLETGIQLVLTMDLDDASALREVLIDAGLSDMMHESPLREIYTGLGTAIGKAEEVIRALEALGGEVDG